MKQYNNIAISFFLFLGLWAWNLGLGSLTLAQTPNASAPLSTRIDSLKRALSEAEMHDTTRISALSVENNKSQITNPK